MTHFLQASNQIAAFKASWIPNSSTLNKSSGRTHCRDNSTNRSKFQFLSIKNLLPKTNTCKKCIFVEDKNIEGRLDPRRQSNVGDYRRCRSNSDASSTQADTMSSTPEAQWTPGGRTMPEIYEELTLRLRHRVQAGAPDTQVLVAVAGGPGSGKSTLAEQVCLRLNSSGNGNLTAQMLPMDGFHLSRAELDTSLDPTIMHRRRGAHFTFDAGAFVQVVKELRSTGSVVAPSFDHRVGDPIPEDISISPHTRIVLVEGNYLLLDYYPWSELTSLFDEKWFIDCDIDVAMDRVERRHVFSGWSPEEAITKVKDNDRINALLIQSTSRWADVIIPSIQEDLE
eukprot:CAMPEP_0196584244 /NCGR_PEP_ID=MMETSP1081-20130531/46360_1 /TAXON_ID=36882 /ORGANISM="Pyramimonas amylifera, Strain CCMP720" /LENGTH=338 /DNA_ID=CAMNT_0041905383 /DNA_START=56 /DNA_END=1072 /DNA_ORIENTATION=+